jgi:hypothetical protein
MLSSPVLRESVHKTQGPRERNTCGCRLEDGYKSNGYQVCADGRHEHNRIRNPRKPDIYGLGSKSKLASCFTGRISCEPFPYNFDLNQLTIIG